MARPRLGESETKRLQMVITEDELAAVDAWRFAKHIGSRSEAIRRLVQVGLAADGRLREHAALVLALNQAVERLQDEFYKRTEDWKTGQLATHAQMADVIRAFIEGLPAIRKYANLVALSEYEFAGAAEPYSTEDDMTVALKKASENRALGEERFKRWRASEEYAALLENLHETAIEKRKLKAKASE